MLAELGKIIIILLTAVYNGFVWGGDVVAEYGGEPARLLFYIIVLIVIPFILITHSIAKTQAGIEGMHAALAGLFLKAIAVGLITFVILFILSAM